PVTHAITVPTFRTLEARTNTELKFEHTLVLAAKPEKDDEKVETLVILTPHVVKSEKDAAKILADELAADVRRNENVRTVYVPLANNRAAQTNPYRGFEADATKAAILEIAKTTHLRVISDYSKADTELILDIVSVTKNVLNVNQKNEVREGEL